MFVQNRRQSATVHLLL